MLQEDFAAILLDVQMPGLDGFETAELIRTRERTRSVPIIFVTAISKAPENVFRGYGAGAVDYLFKPVDAVVLRSKVEVFGELYERGRALAEREELLRATFEDAPIGMARAGADGRLRHVNRALTRDARARRRRAARAHARRARPARRRGHRRRAARGRCSAGASSTTRSSGGSPGRAGRRSRCSSAPRSRARTAAAGPT